jgi:hypothetical protein
MKIRSILLIASFLTGTLSILAIPEFCEIRTASNQVIVAFFRSDTVDLDEINTVELSGWKINGQQPVEIHKYVMHLPENRYPEGRGTLSDRDTLWK